MHIPDQDDLRSRLRHIRWIGGPPDAGKSTVAALVAEAIGADLYRQDTHERRHIQKADPERHPRHAEFRQRLETLDDRAFLDSLWLQNDPETMAQDARANWVERMDMICADLLAMPTNRPIVAEGPGFFPAAIVPLLVRPEQAIWLIPTETFKRESHARRGKSGWADVTADPDRARINHVERDLVLARIYRDEIAAHHLPAIDIDGTIPPEEIAAQVRRQFASLVDDIPGTPATE